MNEPGKILRTIRKAQKVRQTKLAEITGIERTTVTKIEIGNQQASIKQFATLLDALGYEIIVAPKGLRHRI